MSASLTQSQLQMDRQRSSGTIAFRSRRSRVRQTIKRRRSQVTYRSWNQATPTACAFPHWNSAVEMWTQVPPPSSDCKQLLLMERGQSKWLQSAGCSSAQTLWSQRAAISKESRLLTMTKVWITSRPLQRSSSIQNAAYSTQMMKSTRLSSEINISRSLA